MRYRPTDDDLITSHAPHRRSADGTRARIASFSIIHSQFSIQLSADFDCVASEKIVGLHSLTADQLNLG